MKYSVEEIDAMRHYLEQSYTPGSAYFTDLTRRSIEVEQYLRTYMQNGTTVDELKERYEKMMRAWQESTLPK